MNDVIQIERELLNSFVERRIVALLKSRNDEIVT